MAHPMVMRVLVLSWVAPEVGVAEGAPFEGAPTTDIVGLTLAEGILADEEEAAAEGAALGIGITDTVLPETAP